MQYFVFINKISLSLCMIFFKKSMQQWSLLELPALFKHSLLLELLLICFLFLITWKDV